MVLAAGNSILVLNVGSSSLKFAQFAADERPSGATLLCEGEFAGIGHQVHFSARRDKTLVLADEHLPPGASHEAALERLLEFLKQLDPERALTATVHRIVHGGTRFDAPVRLTPDIVEQLTQLIPLAPLHQPPALAAIAAVSKSHPRLPQIACFDTAFHHNQSSTATAFALPRKLSAQGIRRFGFHGISYQYIASALPDLIGTDASRRVVVAHLGGGASMCALLAGKSIATTMSFTPLDGLPMGRRCGSLDPGVVLYLLQHEGMGAEQISKLLYEESGLLGVSGITDDMQELLSSSDVCAAEAIDLFVYRIGLELGALAAALQGLDALVFTGGIGEHAVPIRRRVCQDARWLGIDLDIEANEAGAQRISQSGSKVSAWVIATDEDLMMAREAWKVLRGD